MKGTSCTSEQGYCAVEGASDCSRNLERKTPLLIQKAPHFPAAARMPELPQRLGFDPADTLAGFGNLQFLEHLTSMFDRSLKQFCVDPLHEMRIQAVFARVLFKTPQFANDMPFVGDF
jgi:hypothetical protein